MYYTHSLGAENKLTYYIIGKVLVRVIGLEPTRPKAPEPKSGASTNFATPALQAIIVAELNICLQKKQKFISKVFDLFLEINLCKKFS